MTLAANPNGHAICFVKLLCLFSTPGSRLLSLKSCWIWQSGSFPVVIYLPNLPDHQCASITCLSLAGLGVLWLERSSDGSKIYISCNSIIDDFFNYHPLHTVLELSPRHAQFFVLCNCLVVSTLSVTTDLVRSIWLCKTIDLVFAQFRSL